MAESISAKQFHDEQGTAGWHVLYGGAQTVFPTASFATGWSSSDASHWRRSRWAASPTSTFDPKPWSFVPRQRRAGDWTPPMSNLVATASRLSP